MTSQKVHSHCSAAVAMRGLPDAVVQASLGPTVEALPAELPAGQQQQDVVTHGNQADRSTMLLLMQ